MADPDRTLPATDPDLADDQHTKSPGEDATLLRPSEPPDAANLPTVPAVAEANPSETLALPVESLTAGALPPSAPLGAPEMPVPPTIAPPRFDRDSLAETLAPPAPPLASEPATEREIQQSTPPGTGESSGTLLDAHLLSTPADEITGSSQPASARAAAPRRALPPGSSAPSTIARPEAMKTGRMPTLTLPKVEGYEVLRELGRGGMGVVYMARQEGLNRVVALKMVLAASRASAEELARFKAEGEAVALLHHPNIVQVYDVGTYQGLPYFSLEYCPGGTLADRAGGKPQPPRLAARIIRDLAHAVHHAHQRLILHRDLKPANVLLAPADAPTEERGSRSGERKSQSPTSASRSSMPSDEKTTVPMIIPPRPASFRVNSDAIRQSDIDLRHCIPKITDFGLAKRLEGDAGHTRDGSVMGTPSYMAPEQAKGKVRELGPPADVYALGAILYDLLTGIPPFRGDTVMDTLHQVIHRDPVAPQRIRAKIPADLDIICMKCLEKDPGKRYASADALAEDLRRYLDGEPILARPAPWWEKTVKWARRRPAWATLAAVVAIVLTGLGVGGYVLAQQKAEDAVRESRLREAAENEKEIADAQRKRAEQLQEKAEDHFRKACAAVDTLLARVGHERLAYEPRMEQIRRELLQKAAAFYEGFLKENADDASVKWQTARTEKNLGDIQDMLGNPNLARQRYQAAIGLFTDLRAKAPDDRRYRRDLAAAEHNLGLLLTSVNQMPEAEKSLRAARDLRQGLLEQSVDDEVRSELAASDHALGLVLERSGDLTRAEAAFKAALVEQQKVANVAGSDERGRRARRDLARSANSLGRLAEATHHTQEAEQYFASARDILKPLAASAPQVPEVRQELGQTYDNLGRLRRDTDPAAAAKDYGEAVQVAEKLVEDFPATPAYRQDLAGALNNLGVLLLAVGKEHDADDAFVRALGLKERLAAEIHWIADYRRDYGAGLNNRGIQLKTRERSAEADKAFTRAVKVLTDLVAEHGDVPDYQRELARTLVNRALTRQAEGQHAEAETMLQQALAMQDKLATRRDALPEYRSELNRTRIALGALHQVRAQSAMGRNAAGGREDKARAESEFRAALAEFRAALSGFEELARSYPAEPDYRYQQALAASALAGLLAAGGQPTVARVQWELSAGLLAPLGEQHPDVPGYRLDLGRTLNDWALNYAMTGSLNDAGKLWSRASVTLSELVRAFPRELAARQELAKVENNRAVLALKANRLDEATAAYRRAVAAVEGLPADSHPSPEYRHGIILRHRDLAAQLADTGAPAREVDEEWQTVRRLYQSLAADVPTNPQYGSELGVADHQLARLLLQQNRPADARPLLEEAVAAQRAALNAASAPASKTLLIEHLKLLQDVLFQLDDYAAAATVVNELTTQKPADGSGRHELAAAALARCASLAAADTKLPESQRQESSQSYADRAMKELKAAVKDGFSDASELHKKQFDVLRNREDFKELLTQLAK